MTESEWLACAEPGPMLEFLRGKASDRKLRLFAVACCRSVWRWIKRRELQRAVEASESFEDGLISQKKLAAIEQRVQQLLADLSFEAQTCMSKKIYAARDAARAVAIAASAQVTSETASRAAAAVRDVFAWTPYMPKGQGSFVREIFGNPFRSLVHVPAWLAWNSGTVVNLARTIYAERRFDILADALEEAGCENPDILAHCRGPGEHVRGCWVVDLILGKK